MQILRSSVLAAFAFGVLGGEATVWAQSEIKATAVFAVAKDPSGQKAAAMADAILRTRVLKSPSLRLIEPARVLSGDPRTREEETLERARAALTDGRRTYDALALDDAIARLGQAVSLYQQTGPLLGDLEELQTALVYLGAALTLRGSADEGESTFVELLTVNPNYQLTGFPPTVERVFEKAAERVDATPSGSVEIYSTPPYAAVYLDGRFEGVTPLTLSDVISGTHYLRLEKLGYTVHGVPLEVAPKQQIASQTRLSSIKRGVELRDLTARCVGEVVAGEGMGGALRELSRQMVSDALIFVTVSQSGRDATFSGGVFDSTTGTRITTERAVLSADATNFASQLGLYIDRLVKAAQSGSAPESNRDQRAPGRGGNAFGLTPGGNQQVPGQIAPTPGQINPGDPRVVAPSPNPYPRYLGWTLVGLGGAALATGAVFGILAKDVHDDFRKTSQGSPDLPNLKDQGQTYSWVADGLYIGGGAALVGGIAVILISNYSNPSPSDLFQAGVAPLPGGGMVSFGGQF